MPVALLRRFPQPCRTASLRPGIPRSLASVAQVRRLWRDEGGSIALLAALSLTLICGVVGLAIDVGVWYRTARAMQNAADAAAVAAARDSGNTWNGTGQAIAARYGFVNGVDGISVEIVKDQTCPGGGTNCFKATIHDAAAPQFFSKVLGVDAPALSTSATASLTAGPSNHQYCILALATSGASPAILTDGAPSADLGNCNVMSNTDMTCLGHDLNAASGDAAGINDGCGDRQTNHAPTVADPFTGLTGNISSAMGATTTSGSSSAQGGSQGTSAGTHWVGGTRTLRSAEPIDGDLVLDGNVTVRTPPTGSVIYIKNGTLNLNGYRLKGDASSGLTVVFTGTNGNSTSPAPYPTGGGMLNIQAPKSGPWSGIAIYIDPRTTPQTITYYGNSPTWKITGLVYMPHASLTVSGAVSKSSNGGACFALIVDNIRINGTGSILVRPEDCTSAGVTLPSSFLPNGLPALVL